MLEMVLREGEVFWKHDITQLYVDCEPYFNNDNNYYCYYYN